MSPLFQVAEAWSQSSSRAEGGDNQMAASFSPTSSNQEASTSSGTPGGRNDPESRPVAQDSEQDTLACQQSASRELAEAAAAVGVAPKCGQSAGGPLSSGSGDGEEKRDQSKEEPLLELRQQEGWWRRFLGGSTRSAVDDFSCSP